MKSYGPFPQEVISGMNVGPQCNFEDPDLWTPGAGSRQCPPPLVYAYLPSEQPDWPGFLGPCKPGRYRVDMSLGIVVTPTALNGATVTSIEAILCAAYNQFPEFAGQVLIPPGLRLQPTPTATQDLLQLGGRVTLNTTCYFDLPGGTDPTWIEDKWSFLPILLMNGTNLDNLTGGSIRISQSTIAVFNDQQDDVA